MTPAGVSTGAFFRVLVESVRDYAIFALDAEGRVLSWNEGAQRMTGYTEAEVFGQPYAIFFPPDAAADGRPRDLLETAAREGRVEDEGWRVRKDGTRYRADAILTALRDAQGELVGYAKVARDLTQRSKADEQARKLLRARVARETAEKSARRMELLARASSILASSLDYDVTLAGVAELVVPSLADFCAVDMVQAGRVRRVAVRHRDPSRARVARALAPLDQESAEGWRGGQALLLSAVPEPPPSNDGKDPYATLRVLGLHAAVIMPLLAHGQVYGALTLGQSNPKRGFAPEDVALAEDLARRAAVALENARLVRDLENVRAQLQEKAAELEGQTADLRRLTAELANKVNEAEAARAVAEEANRAKSRFLATMSHELRTPLNAIAGHADLLALGIHGALNQAQEEALARIQRNEQRLLGLINDIISFAKLEAGQLSCQRKPVPVRDLLLDVHELIADSARRKGVELRVRDGGELRLLADPDKAARVLFNLVENAVKFTDAGGRVEVGTRVHDERVDLFVRDTGRGIAALRLESIFEPFVQVDQEHTRDKEGLGLGLALSRELARSMDGEVDVESELGRGSTFTLTLPLAPADVANA